MENLAKNFSRTNRILPRFRYDVSKKLNFNLLQSFPNVYSIWLYSLALHVTKNIQKIHVRQKKSIRLLTFSEHREHASPVFKSLKVLKFQDIIKFSVLKLIYFYFKDQLQLRVKNIFIKNKSVNPYNTRSGKMLFIPHINTTHFGTKSLKYNDYLTCNNFSQNMSNSNFFNADVFISNIFI